VDFAGALQRLGNRLSAANVRWAVIGGLALAARGSGRLTHDLDIVTERNAQKDLVAFLESLGYETLYVSEGYSNHAHGDPGLGRIDVVYVDDDTADKLFDEAEQLEIFAGSKALVPRAEHLIAMKVLAARNDPTRRLQEMADIADLMRACEIAPEDVRQYFERNDLIDDWEKIRGSL
jgi:hypothetical protein